MALGGVLVTRQRLRGSAQPAHFRPTLSAAIPWLLPLTLLVLWQLSLSFGVFKAHQLPPPLTAVSTAWDQLVAAKRSAKERRS